MGLKLTLKPNERVIVNGCILRNGPRRQVLEVENRANVLRGDEMLDAESAQTPVRKIAYQMQIALVSPQHRAEYDMHIATGLTALSRALPRFSRDILEAEDLAAAGNFYAAFRALSPVIAHEDRLFAHLDQRADA